MSVLQIDSICPHYILLFLSSASIDVRSGQLECSDTLLSPSHTSPDRSSPLDSLQFVCGPVSPSIFTCGSITVVKVCRDKPQCMETCSALSNCTVDCGAVVFLSNEMLLFVDISIGLVLVIILVKFIHPSKYL